MSEDKIDITKLTDYEISMLIIERNACHYKAEQINELLNKIGETKGLTNAASSNEKSQDCQLPGSKDPSELPWKSYKTREKADANESAWIFSKTAEAEALLATLKINEGKVKIGNFEYQLQGKERQFIARKPVK